MQTAWLGAWFYTPVAIGLIETQLNNQEVCANTFVHIVNAFHLWCVVSKVVQTCFFKQNNKSSICKVNVIHDSYHRKPSYPAQDSILHPGVLPVVVETLEQGQVEEELTDSPAGCQCPNQLKERENLTATLKLSFLSLLNTKLSLQKSEKQSCHSVNA